MVSDCRLVITVDGPAASGKSTIARALAEHFGLPFLDTGLIYRAVARRLREAGIDPADEEALLRCARDLEAADLEVPDLADEAIGALASRIAANPRLRAALLPFQKRFAARPEGAVLAGRDTGTVICPEAKAKLFVTASVEERARRRCEQLRRRGERPIYARVLEEMRERDRRDAERAVAPLRAAPDAYVLDTTELDPSRTVAAAIAWVSERRRACAGPDGASPATQV
ncbi:MAG TPA: (d)CMP kinase [Rhodospirillales bacterium]|nr:(d)CMP kinase [Rhodospirillales bacterium]